MSFAEELQRVSIINAKRIQDMHLQKMKKFERKKNEREDSLMRELTNKYHTSIKTALWHAAISGKREKYMNFSYQDFKANFPELGTPHEVCLRWLKHMTDPDSIYLPYKYTGKQDSETMQTNIHVERDHFQGLEYKVLVPSRSFTVRFYW